MTQKELADRMSLTQPTISALESGDLDRSGLATLKAYGITRCYYGHLHGNAIRYAVQGDVDGIRYKLVSADGLRFCPYRIN